LLDTVIEYTLFEHTHWPRGLLALSFAARRRSCDNPGRRATRSRTAPASSARSDQLSLTSARATTRSARLGSARARRVNGRIGECRAFVPAEPDAAQIGPSRVADPLFTSLAAVEGRHLQRRRQPLCQSERP